MPKNIYRDETVIFNAARLVSPSKRAVVPGTVRSKLIKKKNKKTRITHIEMDLSFN